MLVIIYFRTQFHDYIFDGLKNNKNIRTIGVKRRKFSLFIRIVRKVLTFLKVSHFFQLLYFKKSFLDKIKSIEKNESIFITGFFNLTELRIMRDIFHAENKIHFWYWNPLKKEYGTEKKQYLKGIINDQNKLGYKIETFDREDSTHYNIGLRNQFYRFPAFKSDNVEILYDFYFIGYAKDREEEIVWLREQLSRLNFRTEFKIVKNKNEELPYLTITENIVKSKCIIDINQKGQSGMTLRPLEAMFFNKKLLTNNKNIINADFYHPNNVFIIGVDDIETVADFMQKVLVKLPDSVIKKYEINSWMEPYFEIHN